VSGDELEQLMDQADIDGPLVDYEKKGHTVELLGTEDVDGTEAYKVKLTKKNGNETIFFLDTEYCLEIKSQSTTNRQGMEIEVESSYGDYKEVAGVMMVHSMTQTVGGPGGSQVISFTFEKVEPNIDLPADYFTMPEKEEAAEEPAAKESE
jgi:outer membrane lipoprotein-sorting protein